VTALYNPAQRDVLTRAAMLGSQIAQEVLAARGDGDGTGPPPTGR